MPERPLLPDNQPNPQNETDSMPSNSAAKGPTNTPEGEIEPGDPFSAAAWAAFTESTVQEPLDLKEANRRVIEHLKIDTGTTTIGLIADLRNGIPEYLERHVQVLETLGMVDGSRDVVRVAVRSASMGESEILNPIAFNEPPGLSGRSIEKGTDKYTAVRIALEGAPQSALSEQVGAEIDVVLMRREPGVQVFDAFFQYRGTEIPESVLDTLVMSVREDIECTKRGALVRGEPEAEIQEARLRGSRRGGHAVSGRTYAPPPTWHDAPMSLHDREVFSHAKIPLDRLVLGELRQRGVEIGPDMIPSYTSIIRGDHGVIQAAFNAPTESESELRRIASLSIVLELNEARLLQARKVAENPDYIEKRQG